MSKPIIAITMGDPNGIGPELVIKVLSDEEVYGYCRPFLVADPNAIRETAQSMSREINIRSINDVSEAEFSFSTFDILCPEGLQVPKIQWGTVDPAMGKAAAVCIEKAFSLAMENKVHGVISTTLNKEAFHNAGYNYLDELEYMAEITHSKDTTIMGVMDQFWTIPVTEHLPFREIADMITKDRVSKCIELLNDALKKVGKPKPRLAVAALNVHGGEGGLFGNEEIEEISPAIETARGKGILADGPFPADTVFVTVLNKKYDGVVCMYHDQANIPRKLLATRTGATLFMGLPVPCATTAHGTAFDIAGKGVADPGSLANGLKYTAMLAG